MNNNIILNLDLKRLHNINNKINSLSNSNIKNKQLVYKWLTTLKNNILSNNNI